jgi:hypothetical protein
MKTCSKCKIEKEFIEFHKHSKGKYGLNSNCKQCVKKYHKKYNQENKDKSKKYYQENKDKINEYNKKYYQENKQYFSKYSNKYQIKRKKIDSLYKLRLGIRSAIRKSFKRGDNNFKKNTKTEVILGCTIYEFIKHIESQFTEGMTIDNHGEWHLDHIIPLATADTEEDVIRLNHYTNFQPLWAKDNLSKGDKIIEKQLVLL